MLRELILTIVITVSIGRDIMLAISVYWKLPNLKLDRQSGCVHWLCSDTPKNIQVCNLKVNRNRDYLSSSFQFHFPAMRKRCNIKVENLPQMHSLLFSMVQWVDGLFFFGGGEAPVFHSTFHYIYISA